MAKEEAVSSEKRDLKDIEIICAISIILIYCNIEFDGDNYHMTEANALAGKAEFRPEQEGQGAERRYSPRDIEKLFEKLKFRGATEAIVERLSRLSFTIERRNSHFQDAVEISEIIDDLVTEERTETEINELRAVCLLHDVGKSGPAEAGEEERAAMVEIYNLSFDKEDYDGASASQLTLEKALQIKVGEGLLTAKRATELLRLVDSAIRKQKNQRVETFIRRDTNMRTFWSAHVYWTYDILLAEGVEKRLADIAGSHHLLDGCDPAGIGLENASPDMASLELVDKYQAYRIRLVLADKYQAFRVRGGKSHEEAVKILRQLIESRLGKAHPAFPLYSDVLETISARKETLNKELKG